MIALAPKQKQRETVSQGKWYSHFKEIWRVLSMSTTGQKHACDNDWRTVILLEADDALDAFIVQPATRSNPFISNLQL